MRNNFTDEYNKAGIFIAFFLLIIMLGNFVFLLMITMIFWLPLLILNLPFLFIFGLLARYTMIGTLLGKSTGKLITCLTKWMRVPFSLFLTPVSSFCSHIHPQVFTKVLNCGYALLNEDGKLITNLKPEDEMNRFSLQLYHYLATSFNNVKNLKKVKILEVGFTKGIGIAYINNYLSPITGVGLDLANMQCNQSNSGLDQSETSSEPINTGDKMFDIILCIERGYRGKTLTNLINSCKNHLNYGGIVIIADAIFNSEVQNYEEALEVPQMKVVKKEDISISVQHAIKLEEKKRNTYIDRKVNFFLRPIFKKYIKMQNPDITKSMMRRESIYMAYIVSRQH